jgi:hypothetical protein
MDQYTLDVSGRGGTGVRVKGVEVTGDEKPDPHGLLLR